jgi:CheY-like chemotaxis protein
MSHQRPEIGSRVLFLSQNDSLPGLTLEVLQLEGFQCIETPKASAALTMLTPATDTGEPGKILVFMDNLQVHAEGWEFLKTIRKNPGLRARLWIVCMAVALNCEAAREVYGDVLDAYLVLPFSVHGLLKVAGRE